MDMTITFPGGVAVDATYGSHTMRTDQPAPAGDGSAPAPFDLFLASLGTCMGFYALRFCQERGIDTEGLALRIEILRGGVGVGTFRAHLTLPPAFPEKYHDAIRRAVDHCAVKRHIATPPEFEYLIETAEPAEAAVGSCCGSN